MHDPSVLVLSVRRPWPRLDPWAAKLARWSWRPPFASVAGVGFYFPGMVDVWHVEPGGRDSGEVCGYPHGLDVLRHWRHLEVKVRPVLALRRRLRTRCEWCGQGPSRRKGPVNVSHSWERGDGERWWEAERGLYHSGCSTVATAHRTCVCDEPLVPDLRGGGRCAACGHYRVGTVVRGEAGRLAARLLAAVPEGALPSPDVRDKVALLWLAERREREDREESRS